MKRFLCMLAVLVLLCMASAAEVENPYGIWWVMDYVDDWGDPTDDPYITAFEFEGTYSGTQKEKLPMEATVVIDPSYIRIFLYKNGEQIRVLEDYAPFTIKLKDKDGQTYTIPAYQHPKYGDIYVKTEEGRKIFLNVLQKGGVLKILVEDDTQKDRYNFTIEDTSLFREAYKEMLIQEGLGMWQIGHFSDTGEPYVANKTYITAEMAQGRDVRKTARMYFVISSNIVRIFFEMEQTADGETNWVDLIAEERKEYKIVVNRNGKSASFNGNALKGQDRITLPQDAAEKFVEMLDPAWDMEAVSSVSITCREKGTANVFSFVIRDPGGLMNAYRQVLKESK